MIVRKTSEIPLIEVKELHYRRERRSVTKTKMRWIIHGKIGDSKYRKQVALRYFEFEPGATIPIHDHPYQEIAVVLNGKLNTVLDGKLVILERGDVLYTYPWEPHTLTNESDEIARIYCIIDCPDPDCCIPPTE